MSKLSITLATIFVLVHVAFVAPFVPASSILPAAFGAVSMTSMALSLILAARWRLVDQVLGGPDKSYVAHRWLGFLAVAGALIHWASASAAGAAGFPLLAESGEGSGTIAATGLLVLTAAALVRAIPYHLWKASHMLMGPIFLFAAYHTFFVVSPLAVGAAPWTLMAVVSIVGLAAWAQTLRRKLTPTRLVTVDTVERFAGGVDVTFRSDAGLPTFRAGQHATLSGNYARAEAHPFTIAGGDDTTRRFVIRAAGDWTTRFVSDVAPGQQFRLSGGVGRFFPQTGPDRKPQVWVAGGVGITPFLAALEKMQPDGGAPVTLVYCIKSRASAGGIREVERHAHHLPQVNLVLFSDEDAMRMTEKHFLQVLQTVPQNADVYLCGPEGLKSLVTSCWEQAGRKGRVHSERFDFRGAYSMSELMYVGRPVVATAQEMLRKARDLTYAPAGS